MKKYEAEIEIITTGRDRYIKEVRLAGKKLPEKAVIAMAAMLQKYMDTYDNLLN